MKKEMETKESIIKNAINEMNDFANKILDEFDFNDEVNGADTLIDFLNFKGAEMIVYWWDGFATSRFLPDGYNNFSISDGNGINTDDLNTIAEFHNRYLNVIREKLAWFEAEMARAESTDEVDAAGGFYLKD